MLTSIVGRTWTRENNISSEGLSQEVILTNLGEGALELFGRLVRVDGRTRLNGIFSHDPFQPGKTVTQDGFDQVQLYHSINSLQEYLLTLGVDAQAIISSRHGGRPHPVSAHANAIPDLNAYYSPQNDDLTFGTNGDPSSGQDKWHLASDGDVVIHESGHLFLDHINRGLGGWWTDRRNYNPRPGQPTDETGWSVGEGRAIHEGFGDILAALFYDDQEMSEDFAPNIGRPPNKTDGLRNVNNDLTIENSGAEEHDRGQVYAGFFWSIKKHLQDPNGPFKLTSRQAADLTLKIVFNHASNYTTSRPKPSDFVAAVLRGAEGLAKSGQLPPDLEILKSLIISEAARRKMITIPRDLENTNEGMVSAVAASMAIAGGPNTFRLDQMARFHGGSQEIYQQQYKLQSGLVVDVVGGAMHVQKDQNGSAVFVSLRDVFKIPPEGIDETIRLDQRGATTIAYASAQRQLLDTKNKLMHLMFAPMFARPQNFLAIYKESQMEYRIAETAVKSFNTRFNMSGPPTKLVIIPGINHLQYEIKVGLGIYYVDAQTGSVTFKRDVIMD